ncbi:AraC family transcriptional regulator [Variovorax ginsengisoli]|uniref:AraC family transcriptional regulator n=1 Tax=Variovorax ginsengisoli TaxID=363844 RepID=A0ABT8SDE7_9BURK|nr:AraC family transcriptional regulator [Variovorax ginsengisoli]MDN8617779.1 AraC family transcriptional regulator [Variovorax ginsengisoli]MDO1536949.1 AraC family transcriptional regulator [Variovorax ginsengisoli]
MADSRPKGTISVDLVREAVQVAIERGFDVPSLLGHSNIDADLVRVPRARVTATAYARLWAVLADAMDDEFFGMDSHPMRRGSFRLMCQVAMQARTLERALNRILAFLRSILDDFRIELLIDGNRAILRVHDRGEARRMFAYATLLILVHGLCCWLVRRRIPLLEASFRCSAPQAVDDYRSRFCASATFDEPVTQVSFDVSFLVLKPTTTELGLQSFLRGAPANLLVKYRDDAGLAARIRSRLRRERPNEWPDLNGLAQDMGIAATTLQRRLQGEGTAYQAVKDELRRDIAIDLLSDSARSVAEVADQVGFQETSAFHRAFKKWTGVSPGAYRRSTPRPP